MRLLSHVKKKFTTREILTMEMCIKCGKEWKNHGSACGQINSIVDDSTGYYFKSGTYRIIDGKLFRVITDSSNLIKLESSETSKITMKWISVKDRLPHDMWFDNFRSLYGDDNKAINAVNCCIDSFLVVVDNNDPNNDPEVIIADYTKRDGWLYSMDFITKYDGKPWFITHWAIKPEPPTI